MADSGDKGSGDQDDYIVVAAMDFGTTYSGYGFSMKTNPSKVFMSKSWGGYSTSQIGVKAPTSILVDKKGKMLAFGFEAEKRYSEAAGTDEQDELPQCYLFQHFKMRLHKLETVTTEEKVESKYGDCELNALQLVTKALRYMKERVLLYLTKQIDVPVREEEIRWVVTVPAIWSAASKTFMRKAAYKAGLIKTKDSNKLLIALEPEAAALHCRSLNASDFSSEATDNSVKMPIGTKYMIVDIGGGTLDIAVHEVVDQEGAVRELSVPSGGDWGGMKVNQAFEELLGRILSKFFVKAFQEQRPLQWYELMHTFENAKRSLDYDKTLRVSVSHELASKYKEMRDENIEQAFARAETSGLNACLKSGIMLFKKEAVHEIFKDSVKGIVNHLKELFEKPSVQGVDHVMLVGGYSESPYLQHCIREEFGASKIILIPQNASLAVTQGAVLFGHNPHTIRSRCVPKTFGTGTLLPFDDKLHDRKKRIFANKKAYCEDIFHTFVKKGTEVALNEPITYKFQTVDSDSTETGFELYTTDEQDVKYVDEEGVTKVGDIIVPLVSTRSGSQSNKVEIQVRFGGTEIEIRARYMGDPKWTETKLMMHDVDTSQEMEQS